VAALRCERLAGVVICPSNPFISIDPILAIPGVREALVSCPAPIVAVSPIINGRAVKGPTAKMMRELGLRPSAAEVARRYGNLLDGYLLDEADAGEASGIASIVTATPTLMTTLDERETLARATLDAIAALRRHGLRRQVA
jgi:LPPG:FO 2-phospho-L-lactate transferase